jgi:hypothetical protein
MSKLQDFNRRTSRARISASWPHDRSHYRFDRTHNSSAPFVETDTANVVAEVLIAALAIVGLAFLLAVIGGWL